MAEPFLGEIRLFPMNFTPKGWFPCNGAILNINTYQALFSIVGTTYGGDGRSTFALPDLRGRTPVFYGSGGVTYGLSGGVENHTLTIGEMPTHTHSAFGSKQTATTKTAAGGTWAVPNNADANTYQASANGNMSAKAIGTAGGSAPHSNMQPYLVLNYCICWSGIYPPRP